MAGVQAVMIVRAAVGLVLAMGATAGCSVSPRTKGPAAGTGPRLGPQAGADVLADACPVARVPATHYDGGEYGDAKGTLCVREPADALAESRACAERVNAREHDAALQRALDDHGLTPVAVEPIADDRFGDAAFVGEVVDGVRQETAGQRAVAVAVAGGPCSSVSRDVAMTTGHLTTAADGALVFLRVAPQLAVRSYPYCGCDIGCGQQAPSVATFVALPRGQEIARTVDATFPALEVTTFAIDHSCPPAP